MHSFFSSYLFAIPLFVGLLAESTKILFEGIFRHTWHEGLFRSGGMPSSHSAIVTSLLIVVGEKLGLHSPEFAIAIVFACIVWYDAVSSRRAIGEQAKILNRLQHWKRFSERLGHSLRQVIGGVVFGIIVTYVGMFVLA